MPVKSQPKWIWVPLWYLIFLVFPLTGFAQDEWGELQQLKVNTFDTKLYGFVESYWETTSLIPDLDDDGNTIRRPASHRFSVRSMNVMVQGTIRNRYRYFINLALEDPGRLDTKFLDVRNAWVEMPLWQGYVILRAGKTYRRFGLYNEILDAIPTFIGIEPPGLFDPDHLLLTRTTHLMLHGTIPLGTTIASYALSTGNDERLRNAVPFGADLRLLNGPFLIGSSFYTTGGPAGPTRNVGEGPPHGGVANWMSEDRYFVFGGFAEINTGTVLVQGGYWQADHQAIRDGEAVRQLPDLSPIQEARFFRDGDLNGEPRLNTAYSVRSIYLRLGYEIPTQRELVVIPYIKGDYFENPELIRDKDAGGDEEAGLADDGRFFRYTAGAVIRPFPQVALKVDGGIHHQLFNGNLTVYPEFRVSLSYLWQLDL